ncbi:hypothetical protein ACFLVE_03580 [Chloroflexota bacterium]
MTITELQEKIVTTMKNWQKVEKDSIASTGQIIQKTDNPVIQVVMEIIQRDSQTHYQVQKMIADSLETKGVSLSPDELVQVWSLIEKHIAIEKKMFEGAEQMLDLLKGKGMPVQSYLLSYLVDDERKHNNLLSALDGIKLGMLP